METRGRMILAWISGVIIVGLSLLVAYVCFSILSSSAEGTLQNYKVGGGLAGFLITASFLSSTLISIYRLLTADQITEYRKQIQELNAKLIKGAPCPPEYTIDIDEKHKLVFARPKTFSPIDGFLYKYIQTSKRDGFTTNFNVQYVSGEDVANDSGMGQFDGLPATIDKIYSLQSEKIETALPNVIGFSREHITVDGLASAKYLVTWTLPIDQAPDGKGPTLSQIGVITYVPNLRAFFVFTFSSDKATFFESSTVFNNVITSIRFLP
jgi:hypothetical protein